MTDTEGTDSDTITNIHYSPDDVASNCSFDTIQKPGWVAASIERRPIPGIRFVAPEPLSTAQLTRVHAPEYVEAVRTGTPLELAESNGLGWSVSILRRRIADTHTIKLAFIQSS